MFLTPEELSDLYLEQTEGINPIILETRERTVEDELVLRRAKKVREEEIRTTAKEAVEHALSGDLME